MTQLTNSLNKLLANSYCLYLKTQNYHWNITGPQFNSLHTLFELQYTELAAAIDEIAERIRALGAHALGSFTNYAPLLEISEATGKENAAEMLTQLAGDQATIVRLCQEAIALGQEAHDEATVDLMIGRVQVHEKNKWMLASSMG
jgi:starvation-inducible DNA-binding protein